MLLSFFIPLFGGGDPGLRRVAFPFPHTIIWQIVILSGEMLVFQGVFKLLGLKYVSELCSETLEHM